MATSDSPLNVPNVALAVARGTSQALSGGNAALGWSATSLADGEQLTLKTNGDYSFGVKPQAAPVFYMEGTTAYENGLENNELDSYADNEKLTTSSVFNQSNGPFVRRSSVPLRYPQQNGVFEPKPGSGLLGDIRCFASEGAASLDLQEQYFCFWVYHSLFWTFLRRASYSSLSGQFNEGQGEWDEGEQITITWAGGEIKTGRMVKIDAVSGFVYWTYDAGQFLGSLSNSNGAAISGVNSGATLVTGNDTASKGSNKYFRDAGASGKGGLGCLMSRSLGQFWVDLFDASGAEVFNAIDQYPEDFPPDSRGEIGKWMPVEVYYDMRDLDNSGEVKVSYWINGVRGTPSQNSIPPLGMNINYFWYPVFGFDFSGTVDEFRGNYFCDPYLEDSGKRVVLCKEAIWDKAAIGSDFELQPPTTWSDTELSVNLKRSRFSGKAYLYVFSGGISPVNASGLEVNL